MFLVIVHVYHMNGGNSMEWYLRVTQGSESDLLLQGADTAMPYISCTGVKFADFTDKYTKYILKIKGIDTDLGSGYKFKGQKPEKKKEGSLNYYEITLGQNQDSNSPVKNMIDFLISFKCKDITELDYIVNSFIADCQSASTTFTITIDPGRLTSTDNDKQQITTADFKEIKKKIEGSLSSTTFTDCKKDLKGIKREIIV